MTDKHTPGPWSHVADVREYDGEEHLEGWGIEAADGEQIVGCEGILGDGEANARLIAAAPELLAELRIVYERSYNPFEPDNQSEQYKRVGALIAKATGEAS